VPSQSVRDEFVTAGAGSCKLPAPSENVQFVKLQGAPGASGKETEKVISAAHPPQKQQQKDDIRFALAE
jgi:hypothetical protein